MAFFSRNIKTIGLRLVTSQLFVLFGLVLTITLGITAGASASELPATLKQVKIETVKQQVLLRFTLDKAVKYRVFTLKAPFRVVIDLEKTRGVVKLTGKQPAFFNKVRSARRHSNDLRIVLDLKQAISPKAIMKGNELRITLNASGSKAVGKTKQPLKKVIKPVKEKKKKAPARPAAPSQPTSPNRLRRGDFIVAIDAGHGGRDPGALGPGGSREKDIVLQIARRLKQKIDRTPGMKGVMIRDGDYYVPLRERMQIARKKRADLFVSIHADANPNRHLTGSSVYILSQNGASSEAARWLASNENSYESRLGDTSLHGKDNTLATMLMDLSQAATIDNSLTLANNTLRELGRVTRLLHKRVESAAFVVLKSPDIPSMLVETAFISNPVEERRLNTAEYQNKLAHAVFKGVKRFQLVHAPGGRLRMYAGDDGKRHIVKPGDSLSEIARKYGVSMNRLTHHNNLSSQMIRVGQKLYIPTRS